MEIMLFRLLVGTHMEKGKVFSVKTERDTKGVFIPVDLPIVESSSDLMMQFGADKFQKLTESEIQTLLSQRQASLQQDAAGQDDKSPNGSPAASPESEVEKAVKKGAIGIAEPPGKEVTYRFPMARKNRLTIYRKKGEGYLIFNSNGESITKTPVSKEAVIALVENYTE
jgi:hypothetical protein